MQKRNCAPEVAIEVGNNKSGIIGSEEQIERVAQSKYSEYGAHKEEIHVREFVVVRVSLMVQQIRFVQILQEKKKRKGKM